MSGGSTMLLGVFVPGGDLPTANASRATVAQAQTNGTLTFVLSDAGMGFSVGERISGGRGLQTWRTVSMRSDVAFEIWSAPGEGTTILGRIRVA